MKTTLRGVSWRNFQGLLKWTELDFEDSYLQFCMDLTCSFRYILSFWHMQFLFLFFQDLPIILPTLQ